MVNLIFLYLYKISVCETEKKIEKSVFEIILDCANLYMFGISVQSLSKLQILETIL